VASLLMKILGEKCIGYQVQSDFLPDLCKRQSSWDSNGLELFYEKKVVMKEIFCQMYDIKMVCK
jgi:hypothetical protein